MNKIKEILRKIKNKIPGNNRLVKSVGENKRLIVVTLFACAVVMAFIAEGAKLVAKMYPYSINVDGKPICYLESEENAQAVVMDVAEEYVVSGATLTAIDTKGRLTIEKADDLDTRSQIVNVAAASQQLKELTKAKGADKLEFHVACVKNKTVSYTPTPNYKKDKTMLAGDSKVIKKGRKGTQIRATIYTSINGSVISKTRKIVKILDEGKPATIKKGTIGLPKGEDWKTFDGIPVFKNGKEMVAAAKTYMGAPYKYGGSSLTKGIDCVWFVKRMYERYGINIPLSHGKIHKLGKGVSLANAQKGDIVCYSKHVGIYVGDGKMIEATSVAGVRISKVNKKRLVTVRRVVK